MAGLDRKQLADAMVKALGGTIEDAEWDVCFVNHYSDELMEKSRAAVVRILAVKHDHAAALIDEEEAATLNALIDRLRREA